MSMMDFFTILPKKEFDNASGAHFKIVYTLAHKRIDDIRNEAPYFL